MLGFLLDLRMELLEFFKKPLFKGVRYLICFVATTTMIVLARLVHCGVMSIVFLSLHRLGVRSSSLISLMLLQH